MNPLNTDYNYDKSYGLFVESDKVTTVKPQYVSRYWLNELYEDSCEFNEIAGNDKKLQLADFKLQADLIVEETYELIDGLANDSAVEVLDAAVDIAVVLSGLLQKLEALGFNVSTAMRDTAQNNLSKYPYVSNYEEDETLLLNTASKYAEKGISVVRNVQDNRQVFRNESTGKILKPANYVDNDLSEYCPAETLSEAERNTASNTAVKYCC